MKNLEDIINKAFEQRHDVSARRSDTTLRNAIAETFAGLDNGELRVAQKQNGVWIVNEWLKKAILLSFVMNDNRVMEAGNARYFDKVELKFSGYDKTDFMNSGVRVAPPATARYGSYVAPNVVLMPSYVNIGAYVDSGTMVDTWATVGSCAQVGKNVHISGGVGLGGVLEPLQSSPTIIEDDCFIGARSEIVEGVVVGAGAVISMGVYIGQSTRIYHRETGEISYGKVPPGAVVVPGSLPSKDGKYSLYCAVIVKQVDAKTRSKVNLNELLREL